MGQIKKGISIKKKLFACGTKTCILSLRYDLKAHIPSEEDRQVHHYQGHTNNAAADIKF